MEPAKGLPIPLLGGIAAVAALGIALYLYFGARSASQAPEIDAGPDVSAEVTSALETPAEKLPETNPFKGYRNPFE